MRVVLDRLTTAVFLALPTSQVLLEHLERFAISLQSVTNRNLLDAATCQC